MPHEPKKYLSDMKDRAVFVRDFMADKTMEVLLNDRPTRSALERELMVLGEALFQLHRSSPEVAQQIDSWEKIIRFRHVLVHGYDVINMQVLWDVIQDDIGPLIQQVELLLNTE